MDNLKEINAKVNEALSLVKTKIKGFVSEDQALWMCIAAFLFGVIMGMLISPRKNKNFNCNNTYDYRGQKDDENDEDCGDCCKC